MIRLKDDTLLLFEVWLSTNPGINSSFWLQFPYKNNQKSYIPVPMFFLYFTTPSHPSYSQTYRTVMIRFSARGAYLPLVPQGIVYFETGRLISTGRLFLRWETTDLSKQNFNNTFIKRGNNRNCNSNNKKYIVNVQLKWKTQTRTTVLVRWHYRSFSE